MATLLLPRDLEFGDSVLNFGDSLYQDSPDRRCQDNVLRLCAYLLFSNRVGLPTRHLMQNSNLFRLLEWMPELLQDGLVFADVPEGCASVMQSVTNAAYSDDSDSDATYTRADFLDRNSKVLHTFDASGMMSRFRSQFESDLGRTGALRTLLSKHLGDDGQNIADTLETQVARMAPTRHDAFLMSAHSACPKFARALVTRWASVRYYTTPMDFDVCAREVPPEASMLLLEAETHTFQKARASDYLEFAPEPMRSAINVMRIGFPEVFTENDARCLINVVLKTRHAVPEARAKFADVTSQAFEEGLMKELNGILRDEFSREQLLRQGSPILSDGFRTGALESVLDKVVDIAAVQYSPIVGGIRAAAAPWLDDRRLRATAPWKTTCEYLGHHHRESRVNDLLKSLAAGLT